MKIFDLCNDLSNISRWSQVHCNRNESVLEHTAFVAIYGLQLAIKHGACDTTVMMAALVHDFDEVVTGDIPKPTKYANGTITHGIKQLEADAVMQISKDVFNCTIQTAWGYAKDATIEGQIIQIADCAACVYKFWQEINSGNKEFLKFQSNIRIALDDLSSSCDDIFEEDIYDLIKILEGRCENT